MIQDVSPTSRLGASRKKPTKDLGVVFNLRRDTLGHEQLSVVEELCIPRIGHKIFHGLLSRVKLAVGFVLLSDDVLRTHY
jgi:hypothetical protein